MVHTKKHDLTDGAGAVIPPPQPPQPPSPSRFVAAASAIHSTAARVAAVHSRHLAKALLLTQMQTLILLTKAKN
jgi:hypothetical protein